MQQFKPKDSDQNGILDKEKPPIAIAVKDGKVYVAMSEGIAEFTTDDSGNPSNHRFVRNKTENVTALKVFVTERIKDGGYLLSLTVILKYSHFVTLLHLKSGCLSLIWRNGLFWDMVHPRLQKLTSYR